MAWRLVKSLDVLRKQINARYPKRSKLADGTIGDKAHQARVSDHNQDPDGTVDAIDLTHDPKNGFDAGALAERLRQKRDPRIKYVIWNKRMFSSTVKPWVWRPASGHTQHVHISVNDVNQDDTRPWDIFPPQNPTPPLGGNRRNTKIVATVFDDAMGAYGPIDHSKFVVSLPAPMPRGSRVRLFGPAGTAVADVDDKGPHYDGTPTRPADPYWVLGTRPRAEREKPNKAGIDLNPKLAEALGFKVIRNAAGKIIAGGGLVDWVLL